MISFDAVSSETTRPDVKPAEILPGISKKINFYKYGDMFIQSEGGNSSVKLWQ